jgi:hypothetical protein
MVHNVKKPVEAVCIYIYIYIYIYNDQKSLFLQNVCSKTKISKIEALGFYIMTSRMTFMITH